jgi:SNF2 family DNA or RNA helicase
MARLVSKQHCKEQTQFAYDIEVEDNHNYFVENVLVHNCKNPTSQQGKAFLKVNCDYKLALTGTPLMNTPLDLYIILRWLGYEEHAFYAFKNHYCIMGGFGGYEIVGYKNLKELQEKLDTMMLRRLKQDVLDLPEKLFIDEYVEMTPKQEVIYKEVYNQIKANIDQITISPNPLANLIRLRQATGFTGILSSTIQESAKLDRMEELVAEAVSNSRKVVIFSNWTQMTDVIVKRLKKYKGVVITGETNDAQRMLNVNEFQNNPNCNYIVGTIGALGTGLTLTAGTVEIFLDEPWNRALLDQAVDRCHRVGTKENVTIYILMCKNTIDERVHDIVNNKGAMSDVIVDGKVTGDRKVLLNFLLN